MMCVDCVLCLRGVCVWLRDSESRDGHANELRACPQFMEFAVLGLLRSYECVIWYEIQTINEPQLSVHGFICGKQAIVYGCYIAT